MNVIWDFSPISNITPVSDDTQTSRFPHGTLTVPSRYPHGTLTVPSRYLHGTFTVPPRYPHGTLTVLDHTISIPPSPYADGTHTRYTGGIPMVICRYYDDNIHRLINNIREKTSSACNLSVL